MEYQNRLVDLRRLENLLEEGVKVPDIILSQVREGLIKKKNISIFNGDINQKTFEKQSKESKNEVLPNQLTILSVDVQLRN